VIERGLWEGTIIDKKDLMGVPTLASAFKDQYALHWSETKDALGVKGRFATLCRFIPKDTPVNEITKDRADQLVIAMKESYYTRSKAEGSKRYPYSRSTINRVLALLGYLLNRMEDKGLLHAPKLPKSKEKPRTFYLTETQEVQFLDALVATADCPMDWRCLALFEFLLDTGCRMGEAFDIPWSQIDLETGRLRLIDTKNGHDVMKPLTGRAIAVLKAEATLGHPSPFLGVTEYFYRRAWDKAKQEGGFGSLSGFVRHSLRHTFASRLIQSGSGITVVQGLLGHESAATTERYAHLSETQGTQAIKVLTMPSRCDTGVRKEGGLHAVHQNDRLSSFKGLALSSIAQLVERRTVNPYYPVQETVDSPEESST